MEISIEEKARRYDEAYKKVAVRFGSNVADEIFPELKESEDEKIKREIIEYIKIGTYHKDWIAWLEKQGEHAKFCDSIQVGDKVTRNKDGVLVNLSQLKRVVKKDEKQGEQKHAIEMKSAEESLGIDSETYNKIVDECIYGEQTPVDKVEPKFKAGDWLIYENGSIYYVNAVYEHTYELVIDNGDKPRIPHELIDKKARLWTIKDAKDGDVLYSPCCKLLWIYKDEKTCHVGSNLNYNSGSIVVNKPICIPTDVHPATKEQRDRLEEAISDAGYTFDFDKKELKKIEQTPAWSEEDETILKILNELVDTTPSKDFFGSTKEKCIFWLKSLRPQNRWKPSEEQLKALKEAVDEHFDIDGGALWHLYEDLKKLREE